MIDMPTITRTDATPAAVIHLTIPRATIRSVMTQGIGEVMAAVAAQGLTPAGPWFTHHHRLDPETFDFEIGVPVSTPIAVAGRVTPGHLPAAEVARTIFHGPYDGLGAAWRELDEWIRAHGHSPAQNLWECYIAGPASSHDPAAWRTELFRPLSG